MGQKTGRSVAALTLVLAAVVSASPAQAAPSAANSSPNVAVAAAVVAECGFAISTGFGPVRMCIRPVRSSTAQMYYHSDITGRNTNITGELEVLDPSLWAGPVKATDGTVAMMGAFARLSTAYGGARWGMQFQESRRLARFGSYNVVTRLFYPSSGWLPY